MLSFQPVSELRQRIFQYGIFLFFGIQDDMLIRRTHDEMIRKAITERKLLTFQYDDLDRIVEPHVYGRKNEKNGILAYQTGGSSSSGVLGWKRMYFAKIANMRILDEEFDGKREIAGKHSPWDIVYHVVD